MIRVADLLSRTSRDAEAIRAGGVFRICDHCLRDFVGRPGDLLCSRRCRLSSAPPQTDPSTALEGPMNY